MKLLIALDSFLATMACNGTWLTLVTIGGTVMGLSGSLVLQNNGANDITVTSNGSFLFASKEATGVIYNVTVKTQPAGQTCSVAHGSGNANIAQALTVQVTCAASGHNVVASIANFLGTMVLTLNDSGYTTANAGQGDTSAVTIGAAVADGSHNDLVIVRQPSMQHCALSSNASGTVAA